jgi:mono/diheme cytochrome c family protein
MTKFVLILTLLAVTLFVACSSRTDPPGATGPQSSGTVASQSRTALARTSEPKAPVAPLQPGDAQHGQAEFAQYCGVCHQDGKNGAPPLAGVFQRRELPSGTPATDDRMRDTIKMGRSNMPGFGSVLSEQQVSDIVAYLHTI